MSSKLIHIISKSTIKADSMAARINLTPWDLELLFLEYSQKGLLFFKPTPFDPSLIIHLKTSLQRALHFFPPLAGRLTATASHDGAAKCFCIEPAEHGGALFIHAAQDQLTVAGIANSNYNVPDIVGSFFPLNGVSQPLLAVQVTELVDGLFIGCSINHLLVDGTSFWHFFNAWAQISRSNTISKLPSLNRDQINLDLIGSSCIYISNQHLINLDNVYKTSESSALQLKLSNRVFCISKQSVSKLKEIANQEMDIKISSLQAVIAHVWRSIVRCRVAPDIITSSTFEIPTGARQRRNPPLPEEYFGNAVFPGVTTLECGSLLLNGPGWVAREINRMVASNNGPDKVREFCMGWINNPKFLEFDGLSSNHFILINSPRFNVYGNDFGWGKPIAVRCGRANEFDGRITVSGGSEEGSMEIEACLIPETLSRLTEDAEFMKFVR